MLAGSLHWILSLPLCNAPRLEGTDKLSRRPSDKHESDQNFPTIRIAVSCHREVVADHQNDDWNRHEGIVLGAQLGLGAERSIELGAGCCRGDHFALCWKDSEPHVGGHDRTEYRPSVNVSRTAA